MEHEVRCNKQEGRFELGLEGGRTAYVEYEEAGEGVLALTHTEVPAEFEGKGVGGALVKGALEIVRGENLKIVSVTQRPLSSDSGNGKYVNLQNILSLCFSRMVSGRCNASAPSTEPCEL